MQADPINHRSRIFLELQVDLEISNPYVSRLFTRRPWVGETSGGGQWQWQWQALGYQAFAASAPSEPELDPSPSLKQTTWLFGDPQKLPK